MRIAVLGGGNGALAAAAHLTYAGHEVTLYNRTYQKLSCFVEEPTLKIGGGALPVSSIQLERVSKNLATALAGAELIVVCVPALGQAYYAQAMAPLLQPEQTVLLNPGHVGGALVFAKTLRDFGYQSFMDICETHTLTYICRRQEPRMLGLYKISENVMVSSLGPWNKNRERILVAYPHLLPVPSVLHTSLSDHNAIIHPPGMLLNAARIETQAHGNFTFYDEGMTPGAASLAEALDQERMRIAGELDVAIPTFLDAFYQQGYTTDKAYRSGMLYEVVKSSKPNKKIMCETTLRGRYVTEDVGCGLVPLSEIAKILGVPTPVMDSFIELFGCVNQIDYRQTGRTLDKMGLSKAQNKMGLLRTIQNISLE